MAPLPNDEHQDIQLKLAGILLTVIGWQGLGDVRAGVNVSDNEENWTFNYRCPDVVVFLKGTKAQNRNEFWLGGPDFAIEIVSPKDASREKLDFYARVGVRELLIVDRQPWALQLYRLKDGELVDAGSSALPSSLPLRSEVVPLTFRLIPGTERPRIEVARQDGSERWNV